MYLCGLGLLSTFRVSSINYYLVFSLPIHKICALCGIFRAISVLLTTENSDDLEIRVLAGSRSLKVIPVNSLRVISY